MSETIQRKGMRTSNVEEKEKPNTFDLEERLLDYATQIIRLVELLSKSRVGRHMKWGEAPAEPWLKFGRRNRSDSKS
jgi:hypothetical protein